MTRKNSNVKGQQTELMRDVEKLSTGLAAIYIAILWRNVRI